MLERINLFGSSTIGIYACVTDSYCLVPGTLKPNILERFENTFKVPCIPLNVTFKRLIGIMMVGNSRGLLLPNHINPNDEVTIREAMGQVPGVKIHVLEESKLNALGNLIAPNDNGALISSKFQSNSSIKVIEEVLGGKVKKASINNSPLVGTKIVVNSSGCLVTPLATDEEAESLHEIYNVENVDFSTVCMGIESIRIGILANSEGAFVGESTSGPEMARISEVLEV
ncbi:MAG: translation initiation factor IF-6 [Candidatus Hodarchaeota archaeon]